MLYNPTAIAQILSTQANYVDRHYGQMFYYTDQNQIWYDTKNNGRVAANDIVILQFERERANYVPSALNDFPSESGYQIPSSYLNFVYVYVVETNCLYKYQSGIWSTIYGIYGSTTVAQTYLPDGTFKTVVADDVTTNGILNDGSVIIRDNNKMICGQLSSDGYVMNIRSLIGGCLNLDPSGYYVGNGCLQLTANPTTTTEDQTSVANLNANLTVFGSINTVNPSVWSKQYRLATEDIEIISNSTIAAGSTLKADSKLGDTNYVTDTVLTDSVTANTGVIKQNSKIYKDSSINGNILVPPFNFDTDSVETYTMPVITSTSDVTLSGTTLTIDAQSFNNIGDTCYISYTNLNITKITKVKLKNIADAEYDVDYVSQNGITNSARIIYYPNNKVKVLP